MRILVAMAIAFTLFQVPWVTAGSESTQGKHALSLKVNVPENTPANTKVYAVVSEYTDWTTSQVIELTKSAEFILSADISHDYDKGALWIYREEDFSVVEKNTGNKTSCMVTRVFSGEQKQLDVTVKYWSDAAGQGEPVDTIAGHVETISAFSAPEIDRTVDLHIYLPPSYKTGEKHFPVYYFLDGNNVFNERISYVGEWQVDETLESLYQDGKTDGVIAVAISNGPKRLEEYMPWEFDNYGQGMVSPYAERNLQFLVQRLKPHIDNTYRTRKDSGSTAIIGASAGGMFALWAGLKRPDIFGLAGVFSPYLPNIFDSEKDNIVNFIQQQPIAPASRFYFYSGELDPPTPVTVDMVKKALLDKGYPAESIETGYDPQGLHCEMAWAKAFRQAAPWLTGE